MSNSCQESDTQAMNNFMAEFCKALCGAIDTSGVVSYLVGPELKIKHFLSATTKDIEQEDYERNFMELDPLSPMRCIPKGKFVACLSQESVSPVDAAKQRYMEEFAKRHRLVDALEVTLIAGEHVFLGCSLLRHEPLHEFTPREIEIVSAFRKFSEFALSRNSSIKQLSVTLISQRFPSLTPREALMTKYVAFGLSNKQLSKELNISLATVKTHLLNIFGKLCVRSRTELAARLYY